MPRLLSPTASSPPEAENIRNQLQADRRSPILRDKTVFSFAHTTGSKILAGTTAPRTHSRTHQRGHADVTANGAPLQAVLAASILSLRCAYPHTNTPANLQSPVRGFVYWETAAESGRAYRF